MRLSNFITQSASSLLGMKWRSCSQSFGKNSFLADRQETDGSTPLTTGDGRPETRDGRLQKSQLLKLCKPPKLINNQFPIPNSQFPILNNQFPITKYPIPNTQFPKNQPQNYLLDTYTTTSRKNDPIRTSLQAS